MRVVIASAEVVPFIKTGGLGDVAGTLANEYRKIGIDSAIVLPLYRHIKRAAQQWDITPLNKEIIVPLGARIEKGTIWKGKTDGGADVYFIENDTLYDREEIYATAKGDYPDNAERFLFYSRGVLEVLKTLNFRVDVIHCNDWHTAFIPVYLKTTYKDEFSNTATLLAIHNIGYQGIFDKSVLSMTGLEGALPDIDTLEINGKINFLKAGLFYSDVITTVSSNYANEILTQDFGFGLESILSDRKDRLFGIVNGIDYREWNPAEDRIIQKTYRKDDLSGKHICKKSLLSLQGMPETDNPLIGMVTRLSSQKGLDIVAEAMEEIMGTGAQVIILGKGDEYLQRVFAELQEKYYPRLSVTIGFNNTLAHKIYAGADIFLMPSRYEPCGLGQLIALRYGTIPVVRNTGGLVDTIMEYNPSVGSGTGFRFNAYSSHELSTAIQRALEFFNDEQHWLKIQRNAMSQDFSWRRSAEQYKSLYQKIVAEKTALKDRSEDLQGF